jgi:hypothetical protein
MIETDVIVIGGQIFSLSPFFTSLVSAKAEKKKRFSKIFFRNQKRRLSSLLDS